MHTFLAMSAHLPMLQYCGRELDSGPPRGLGYDRTPLRSDIHYELFLGLLNPVFAPDRCKLHYHYISQSGIVGNHFCSS